MNAELLELLQSSSYEAWQGCKADGFQPTKAQAEVMATVRAATDSGLFYSRDVLAHCIQALGVPPGLAAIGKDRVEGGEVGMHCYYARRANDASDSWKLEHKNAETLRQRIGKSLGCIMFSDYKRVTGAVIVREEENGTFRVQGKRGRLAYEWLAGATTIINAIDRYAARKAMRAALSYNEQTHGATCISLRTGIA